MCTSPTVLPTLWLEHVQSKSSAQRISEGKKLPTLKIQIQRKGKAEANKRMIISKKSWQESIREEQRKYLKTLFHWLTKGNSLKNRSTSGIRTSQVSAGSSSEDCIMGGDARVAAVTAAMMGVTLAITILAVLVELVLGMRRAVARMEVGVVLWIRVTAALEVVAVASPYQRHWQQRLEMW